MTTEVTLAAAIEDGSLDRTERRDTISDCMQNIMSAIKSHLVEALESNSPNWREGFDDARAGRPNRVASPNYCEGYARGKLYAAK